MSSDFAELLPKHFDDLMRSLPLPHYTLRDAPLNLARCLPKWCLPPDLGPKMYIAYGALAAWYETFAQREAMKATAPA